MSESGRWPYPPSPARGPCSPLTENNRYGLLEQLWTTLLMLSVLLVVFPMLDPNDPMRAVDLFVENPIDFEELWSRSELVELDATSVRIASVADLIEHGQAGVNGMILVAKVDRLVAHHQGGPGSSTPVPGPSPQNDQPTELMSDRSVFSAPSPEGRLS